MSFAVGVMHDHQVDAPFMVSLVRLVQAAPVRVMFHGGLISQFDKARNAVFKDFLANTDAEWLLMLDSDMVFTTQQVGQLIAAADPETNPITGGLYYQLTQPANPVAGVWEDGYSRHWRGEEGQGLVPVDMIGFGFTLIHRVVLEEMGEPWCDNARRGPNGQSMSDDFGFCYRAKNELSYPITLNTDVVLGHVKPIVWYGD